MAFYYESTDLGLRKNFINLHYEDLEPLPAEKFQYGTGEITQLNDSQIQEKEILLRDVKNICTYFYLKGIENKDNKQFPMDQVKNRFCHILEKYQEQSSLLDSLLESIVLPLANVIKAYIHHKVQGVLNSGGKLELDEEFHTVCDALYIVAKVRGVRHVSKYFPHEVRDLEPVVYMLQKSDATEQNTHWESKYVLLLWCSVIVLVPFDLQTIDSNLFEGIKEEIECQELKGSILLCLLNLGITYLRSSTRLRNAGALFLSKLFSRPDVLKTPLLGLFVEWSVATVQKYIDDVLNGFFITGVLESLVEILKTGQRNELKSHLPKLVPLLSTQKKSNASINLFVAKLSQRIGLVYLRPRVVGWAYKKGNQNLASTLNLQIDRSKLVTNVSVQVQGQQSKEEELPMEIADYFGDVDQDVLEAVVDNLLVALTNKDTIVRWSAAKGVGRICSRLELDQADDIFSALLSTCFNPTQGDTAWHGGCLALGELCRRGLILEHRLQSVIQIVCKALVFEQNQGGYSVGVNVRDSACYVAWSAARAYDPQVLLPYLGMLSQTLAVVMLYDREVNVRRAASSTFQELVGRCPNIIPHGIEILSESDYFALALRHNAFLKVAPFVAAFPEYYPQMVDHLAFVKIQSQDKDVRLLASKALSRLISLNPEYFIENRVFNGLLDILQSPSVNSKHGALYALGDLLVAAIGKTDQRWEDKEYKDSVFLRTLTKNDRQLTKAGEHINKFKEHYQKLLSQNNLHLIPNEILTKIIEVPAYIEGNKLLRGKVGEILRVAVCRLMECIANAQLEISSNQYQFYLGLIEEFLKNPQEDSHDAACRSLAVLSQYKFLKQDMQFLDLVLKELASPNKLVNKIGFAQALGSFSADVLSHRLADIVKIVSHVGIAKKSPPHSVVSLDPEMRKFAIKSLGLAVSKILVAKINVDPTLITDSIRVLVRNLQDYTMNKRGDVGLYIRENSIIALQQIIINVEYTVIQEDVLIQIIGGLLQQLMEKIDRVRLVAGSVLQDIFKTLQTANAFQGYARIAAVFSTQNLQEALAVDQGRVDQSFQTDVIEAEVKHLKNVLAQMRQTELVYHWNLPHCCYRLVVPLLDIDAMTLPLLKGLCVSVGGISESIQKFSTEALLEFVQKDLETNLPKIFDAALKLMEIHAKDERIVNPLYKTLALVLEQAQSFSQINDYALKLFEAVHTETKVLESIRKTADSVDLIVELLTQAHEVIGKQATEVIIEYLSCDFPVVRKATADKFYLFLLSNDEAITTLEQGMALQDYLLETDWLADKFDRPQVKLDLQAFIN